ncbi:NADAR family protein [Mesorhizobium sp. M0751]|uniref:NADAR family protein n=1 Tax=unclassified Mesorhizobium TaxID=325217 RepID=UPI0033384C78
MQIAEPQYSIAGVRPGTETHRLRDAQAQRARVHSRALTSRPFALLHPPMIYDRTWLEKTFRAKARQKFLFFWGHQPSKDGRMTTSCFSQWWHAPFTVEGLSYPTAEHWMMAEKARLFGDAQTVTQILRATGPKQAKQLGRQVSGFDGTKWDADKYRIVTEGSFQKFRQNAALREYLLSTHDQVLVEASPVDRVWGIGLAADDERAVNPLLWRGENLLGFALMQARDRLRG